MSNKLQRIQELSTEIERLTAELNQLLNNQDPEEEEFELGNLVEVTNDYRGQRGTRGEVVHITPNQLVIRLENNPKRTIRKNKSSVRKVNLLN